MVFISLRAGLIMHESWSDFPENRNRGPVDHVTINSFISEFCVRPFFLFLVSPTSFKGGKTNKNINWKYKLEILSGREFLGQEGKKYV